MDQKEIKRGFLITPDPTFCVFSASRRSGKTHLMTFLIYKFARIFDNIIIINPTSFNGHWTKYTSNIIERFDEDLITKLMKRQAQLTRKGIKNHVLLLLDDCLSKANFNSKIFEQLACQGRHYQVSTWISTQHFAKIPIQLRMNADYTFIMGNQKGEVLKRVFDEVAGYFDSEKLFISVVREAIKNYGCFVLDNINGTYHRIQAPENLPRFYLKNKKNKRG